MTMTVMAAMTVTTVMTVRMRMKMTAMRRYR